MSLPDLLCAAADGVLAIRSCAVRDGRTSDDAACVVAACLDLLREVRHGRLDEDEQRVTLTRWADVVGEVFAPDPSVEAVRSVLLDIAGATGPREARAFPDRSELRSLKEVARADAGRRPDLLAAMDREEVRIPVLHMEIDERGLHLRLASIEVRGRPAITAYTDADALAVTCAEAGHPVSQHVPVTRSDLRHLLPAGHDLLLDAGPESLLLTEIEVRAGARGAALTTGDLDGLTLDHDPEVVDVARAAGGVRSVSVARLGVERIIVVRSEDGVPPEVCCQRVAQRLLSAGYVGGVVVPADSDVGRAVDALDAGSDRDVPEVPEGDDTPEG